MRLSSDFDRTDSQIPEYTVSELEDFKYLMEHITNAYFQLNKFVTHHPSHMTLSLYSDSLDVYYFPDPTNITATATYTYIPDWQDLDSVSSISSDYSTETYILTADNQTGPFGSEIDENFILAVRQMRDYTIEFTFSICFPGYAGGIDQVDWDLKVSLE